MGGLALDVTEQQQASAGRPTASTTEALLGTDPSWMRRAGHQTSAVTPGQARSSPAYSSPTGMPRDAAHAGTSCHW